MCPAQLVWETSARVGSECPRVLAHRPSGAGQPAGVCVWSRTAGVKRVRCDASSVFDVPPARQVGAARKLSPEGDSTRVGTVPRGPTRPGPACAPDIADTAGGLGDRAFRDSVARPDRRWGAAVCDPGRAFPSLPDSAGALLVRKRASDRVLPAAFTASRLSTARAVCRRGRRQRSRGARSRELRSPVPNPGRAALNRGDTASWAGPGRDHLGHGPLHTVPARTVGVRHNFYEIVDRSLATRPCGVEWLDASGNVAGSAAGCDYLPLEFGPLITYRSSYVNRELSTVRRRAAALRVNSE